MTRKTAIRILRKGPPFSELYDEAWENALTMAINSLKTEMRDCEKCKSHMAFLMAKMAYDDRQAEPKHGRWIKRGDNSWECSVCHEISCCNGNYCVDCGANMRGEVRAFTDEELKTYQEVIDRKSIPTSMNIMNVMDGEEND